MNELCTARVRSKVPYSLLLLPMIVASPVWKLMEVRYSDNASDIRAPVPRSTSTSARKQSRGGALRRPICDDVLSFVRNMEEI